MNTFIVSVLLPRAVSLLVFSSASAHCARACSSTNATDIIDIANVETSSPMTITAIPSPVRVADVHFLHLSFHTWRCWWPLLELLELEDEDEEELDEEELLDDDELFELLLDALYG